MFHLDLNKLSCFHLLERNPCCNKNKKPQLNINDEFKTLSMTNLKHYH